MTGARAVGASLLVAGFSMVAFAPATVGAGGTPPPSSSPSGDTAPATVPPVITTPPSTGGVTLELAQQQAWATVGGDTRLGLRIEGPVAPGMTITVTTHQKLLSRILYEEAMGGDHSDSGTQLPTAIPVEFLPADATGIRSLTLGLQSATGPRDPNRMPIRETGIYPVEIELRDADGRRLSGFVTPIVASEPGPGGTPTIGERLNVAWVFPMAAQPAYYLDGSPDPAVVAELGPGGSIGGAAVALGNRGVPVTVAPGPETLRAWQALGATNPELEATLASFRTLLGTSQILGAPYVPIDVPSLVANGFGAEVGTELSKGTEALLGVLGVPVDEGTAVVRPVDDAAVARLRLEGASRIVVDDRALVPRNADLTPAQPFLLQSEPRNVTAVAADGGLARLLEGPDPPALRAQRFLAALAMVAVELPNVRRGVVVLNPSSTSLDGEVLNDALTGLSQDQPLIRPTTVQQIFESVPLATEPDSDDTVVRELEPITPAEPPVTTQQYRATEDALAGYNSMLPGGSLLSARGEQALLVSLSSAWEGPEGRVRAENELRAVTDAISQFVGGIHVPVNPTITVTASKAEIPVTFLNDTDQTVLVRVRAESDELTFPDGAERELELPPQNTTVRFAVEARGSGTFPLSLRVTSPDGSIQLQQTEVQVRSTFVSNVGVFLTVGAVLFLALWWGNDFRKRRKQSAAGAAADPGAGSKPLPAATPGTTR